jgi:6,7-dimethyl-8-ribityllumazine synthase
VIQPEGEAPLRFGLVAGRFNSLVTDRLLSGALAALRKAGAAEPDCHVAYVPGSFEIPLVAKAMAKSGQFDAIICIGAVVRGATTHYEEVCSAATSGCSHAAVSTGVQPAYHELCLRH